MILKDYLQSQGGESDRQTVGMKGAAKCKPVLSRTPSLCIARPRAECTYCTLQP